MWWLWLACATEVVPIPDAPGPALERVQATVLEAARLGEAGRTEDARIVWRRAYGTFEDELEDPIRAHLGPETAGELELEFGLLRAQLEHSGDRITTHAKTLSADVGAAVEALEALPPPTP